MKNIASIFIFTILASIPVFGQQTIEQQFDELLKKSNNYQEYKVVKKEKIYSLRKNISDSISKLKETIQASSSKIIEQQSTITTLNTELEQTKNNLTISQGKENGILVLGVLTNKTTYTLIVFISLAVLIFIIFVLFIKYKSSFSTIKTTKSKLIEIDEEFENFRQRSLEREQQIRRKLQDEINKNK
ncbi:MAG: hypothetical protein L3J09_09880 [Flavobacteriaceae bacterium]|nr:hypothetical protein [Flavobacteriaceae bacterium]